MRPCSLAGVPALRTVTSEAATGPMCSGVWAHFPGLRQRFGTGAGLQVLAFNLLVMRVLCRYCMLITACQPASLPASQPACASARAALRGAHFATGSIAVRVRVPSKLPAANLTLSFCTHWKDDHRALRGRNFGSHASALQRIWRIGAASRGSVGRRRER